MSEGKPVIDVDGSYLYRKHQRLSTTFTLTSLPGAPVAGWESVSAENCEEMGKKTPPVMPGTVYVACNIGMHNKILFIGLLYTYMAKCTGNESKGHGAFRALQGGFSHWASGRLKYREVNCKQPLFCHVQCSMIPSMKDGLYHVYVLLAVEGEVCSIKKANCECAAGYVCNLKH